MKLGIPLVDERGMTLVEVLVSAIIGIAIVGAAFMAITIADKSTRSNSMAADTQQNIRVAMDLLANDIKRAGFGANTIVGNCNVTVSAAQEVGAIVPADKKPGGVDDGPDKISMIVPTTSTSPAWTLRNATSVGFNAIVLQAGAGDAMAAAGLTPTLNNNDLISIGGLVTARVQSRATDTLTLTAAVAPPAQFQPNTPVYLLQCVTYQVIQAPDANNVCGGTAPCLVRGVTTAAQPLECNIANSPCVPIADGIEDLQVAYACDGCNNAVNSGSPNGVIDDQGTVDNVFNDADWVSDTTWQTAPLLPGKIRLVRVGLVAKQTKQEQTVGEVSKSVSISPGTVNVSINNDHVIAIAGTETAFRRRTLVRTIQTRNVGLF